MKNRIRIFDTLSAKKKILKPSRGSAIRLFVCGPTVYDYSHLGHARTYVFFDFLVKYLRNRGLKVFYLQNITNVDDRIIKRARENGKDPLKLADFFTKEYFRDMKSLGINSVDVYAPATRFIPPIVRQVKTLLKKGYAYKIENDGYYFDISRFPEYGKLSKRTAGQAEDAVSRIDESVRKRNKGDFCLWKLGQKQTITSKSFAVINGEPLWETSLGWGRPGWHIEDTAISEHYFGPQYDLHGGGLDLKFPHHEAEIAQQEAASGKKPFVEIWLHTGMLYIEGKKMSKSLGNFITIRSALKKYPSSALRFLFLSHHYRSPLDFKKTQIEKVENTLKDVRLFIGKLDFIIKKQKISRRPKLKIKNYSQAFFEALDDDINTPKALAVLFKLFSEANKIVFQLNKAAARRIKEFVKKSFSLFGVNFSLPKIPLKIKRLAAEREEFRRNKQFIQSDALRKKIASLGYVIEDTPIGPFLWPKIRSTKF